MLTLLACALAAAPAAFTGTVVYREEVTGSPATETTMLVGPTTVALINGSEKRFVDADGFWRQARSGDAEKRSRSAVPFEPIVATPLKSRVIAGRTASCLGYAVKPGPLWDGVAADEVPVRVEACVFPDVRTLRFADIDVGSDGALDAAFDKAGIHGLPALLAKLTTKGTFSEWKAVTLKAEALGGPLTKLTRESFFAVSAAERCQRQQLEGRDTLRALFVAEVSNQADTGRFSSDLAAIGFSMKKPTYVVKVEKADEHSFVAVATGTDSLKGDVWRIDEKNQPEHVSASPCSP